MLMLRGGGVMQSKVKQKSIYSRFRSISILGNLFTDLTLALYLTKQKTRLSALKTVHHNMTKWFWLCCSLKKLQNLKRTKKLAIDDAWGIVA